MDKAFPMDAPKLHREGFCPLCDKPASSLFLEDGRWVCKSCRGMTGDDFAYIKVLGSENPFDSRGSTAHVKDIKDRRWHPKEKRMFYWSKEKPKSYFFPKGH